MNLATGTAPSSCVDRLDAEPGDRIVEVGCGTGPIIDELLRRFPGSEVTAVDRDSGALGVLRRRCQDPINRGSLKICEADVARGLPLPSSSANAVLAYDVLPWLDNPSHLLREITRVLQPGGQAVIGHIDLSTLEFIGIDEDLSRTVVEAFNAAQAQLRRQDRFIDRGISGLAHGAGLQDVELHQSIEQLDEAAATGYESLVSETLRGRRETIELADELDRQLAASRDAGAQVQVTLIVAYR